MKLLKPVQLWLEQLDAKTFRNYMIALFSVLVLSTGLLLFYYYRSIKNIRKRINVINEQRLEVRDIIASYSLVQQQKQDVDELLAKDPDFKIVGYFNSVLDQHKIPKESVRTELRETELDTGHKEVTLYAYLVNINMKTIAELLDTLERKERIYTKEIDITKPTDQPVVNLNIVIATLEPPLAGTSPTPETAE